MLSSLEEATFFLSGLFGVLAIDFEASFDGPAVDALVDACGCAKVEDDGG